MGEDERNNSSFTVGYGKAWAKIGGPFTILVFIVILGLVVHTALAERAVTRMEGQHGLIHTELQLQTCVLSMTPQERIELRERWARSPAGTLRQAMILYCPWLRTLPRDEPISLWQPDTANGAEKEKLQRMLNALD